MPDSGQTWRVRTPSRLHFGLLCVAASAGHRRFGGAGLMIDTPGVEIVVRPAQAWLADGTLADRALAFARQAAPHACSHCPLHVTVARCSPEHAGLGTGTQLGLAVARAVALASGENEADAVQLAHRVGRGRRSAIGVHGFAHGGFLVDGGKRDEQGMAPLVARADFPDAWRIILIAPRGSGVHGNTESQAFTQSAPADQANTDAMSRLLLLGILPALHEKDLPTFGEVLFEFNRRAGEWFRTWQNGKLYSHPMAEAVIDYLRRERIRGVGQSSWGPALFAVVEAERANDLAARLRHRFELSATEVLVTAANNRGAVIVAD